MLTRRFTVADENIRVGLGGLVGFLMSDRSQLVSTCLQNHGRAERSGRFFQTPLGPNWPTSIVLPPERVFPAKVSRDLVDLVSLLLPCKALQDSATFADGIVDSQAELVPAWLCRLDLCTLALYYLHRCRLVP